MAGARPAFARFLCVRSKMGCATKYKMHFYPFREKVPSLAPVLAFRGHSVEGTLIVQSN